MQARLAGILGTIASASLALAADVVDRAPTAILELEGTIGTHAIRMHLEKRDVVRRHDGESDVVGEDYSGWYGDAGHSGRLELRGRFNAQGTGGAEEDPEVEIAEYAGGKKTGVFIGRFDDRSNFAGTWESWEPPRELPFSLRVVKKRRGAGS